MTPLFLESKGRGAFSPPSLEQEHGAPYHPEKWVTISPAHSALGPRPALSNSERFLSLGSGKRPRLPCRRPPTPLTVLADVNAVPRFVVGVPRAVIPEIEGLLPREGPPGLGWTERQGQGQEGRERRVRETVGWGGKRVRGRRALNCGESMDLVRTGAGVVRGKGRVDAPEAECRRGGARERGGASEEGRGGSLREETYLVQGGHEKQDENEDVKGRDH